MTYFRPYHHKPANPMYQPWVFCWPNAFLAPIWDALDHCTTSNYPEKSLVPGYSVSEAGALANQYHINRFTQAQMEAFATLIDAPIIPQYVRDHFGSNYTCCNVRAWRYVHGPQHVGEHEDRIAPRFLKIMAFRGEVGPDDGPFEYWNNGWQAVTGSCPLVIIDTGRWRHRAFAPKPGHVRDCVEMTLLPQDGDDLGIVNAGYMAGAPLAASVVS